MGGNIARAMSIFYKHASTPTHECMSNHLLSFSLMLETKRLFTMKPSTWEQRMIEYCPVIFLSKPHLTDAYIPTCELLNTYLYKKSKNEKLAYKIQVRRLLPRATYMNTSDFKFPKDLGISPVKLLLYKSKLTSFFSFPSSSGIFPPILFLYSSRYCKY